MHALRGSRVGAYSNAQRVVVAAMVVGHTKKKNTKHSAISKVFISAKMKNVSCTSQ